MAVDPPRRAVAHPTDPDRPSTEDAAPGSSVAPCPPTGAATAEQSLDEVLREDGRRIVAVLARSLGDLDVAEEAIQDAAVAALEVWGRLGVPDDPAAWLYVAARRKALDLVRREGARRAKEEGAAALAAQVDRELPPPSVVRDDLLRLIFTCFHPALELSDGVADPYQLQAAIAACHATAPTSADTDWVEIDRLYGLLGEVYPNPVVQLNATVARAEVAGPTAGLAALDEVDAAARSYLWHAARAEMFRRLQRADEAREALGLAIEAAPTEAERRLLDRRVAALG